MNKRQPQLGTALFFIGAALLVTGGCRQREQGAVSVTVIGQTPRIADPASGPLEPGEAILLLNVAQGLVRFDAQGQIEPGLAERWNVSDDGLSYIFRLSSGEWPDGRKINAEDVARLLRRQIGRQSDNALKDTFGAVDEIVAMTDRVIEIRLKAPRPHLLQLLAQPEFALLRDRQGTGPFAVEQRPGEVGGWVLKHELPTPEGEEPPVERVQLRGTSVDAAIAGFVSGNSDLVLGGTFADLGAALGKRLPRGTLRFDPAMGLFGLVPARSAGLIGDRDFRSLLDQSIDRDALVAALAVPELTPRTTILHPGLDGFKGSAAIPTWGSVPLAERQARLAAEAQLLIGEAEEPPVIRIALPEGPGAAIVLQRLRQDWGALGIRVELAEPGQPTDLWLFDLIAPSQSPAWYLRRFRCGEVPVCDEEADALMDAARQTTAPPQRAALFGNAERRLRSEVLFIPIAAPVRWSLARGLSGFAENRFSRHPLTGLRGREAAPRRE